MKFTAAFLLVPIVLQIHAKDLIEIWAELRAPYLNGCICYSGADPALVEKWFSKNTYFDNPCFKCFLECIAISLGTFDRFGDIQEEIILKKYGVSKELVVNCSRLVEDNIDPCQKAYAHETCVIGGTLGRM